VELRISDLEAQLKDYELIKEDITHDKVTMGSIVKIMNTETKEETEYKIVGSTEADILAEVPKISNESPVGKAILGKKAGENVKVTSLSGKFEYKITTIV
jgi:transcription elongation factor GreA